MNFFSSEIKCKHQIHLFKGRFKLLVLSESIAILELLSFILVLWMYTEVSGKMERGRTQVYGNQSVHLSI